MKAYRIASKRNLTYLPVVAALLLVGLPPTCTADVAVFQFGAADPSGTGIYTNFQDTMLVEYPGLVNQNYGGRGDFQVGEFPGTGNARRHALLRFDVTCLAGKFSAISNITLRLHVTAENYVENGDTPYGQTPQTGPSASVCIGSEKLRVGTYTSSI